MDIYPAVRCFLSSLPSTTITTTASISFAYCIIMMSLIYLLQTVWIPCSSTTGGRYDGCYFERVCNPLRKMLLDLVVKYPCDIHGLNYITNEANIALPCALEKNPVLDWEGYFIPDFQVGLYWFRIQSYSVSPPGFQNFFSFSFQWEPNFGLDAAVFK